jgi:penicillin-binding protein 1A
VTVLDMAHAYETFANRGTRINGSLGAAGGGPVGINFIREDGDEDPIYENEVQKKEVFSTNMGDVITPILQSVVTRGTGVNAQYGGFAAGKTGTTENYGDAWFVGWNERFTVAVWVGYPDSIKSMETEYGGQPVAGGTFPADIWRAFMVQAEAIYEQREAEAAAARGEDVDTSTLDTGTVPVVPSQDTSTVPDTATTETPVTPQETEDATPTPDPEPTTPTPETQATPEGDENGTGGASPEAGGTAAPTTP